MVSADQVLNESGVKIKMSSDAITTINDDRDEATGLLAAPGFRRVLTQADRDRDHLAIVLFEIISAGQVNEHPHEASDAESAPKRLDNKIGEVLRAYSSTSIHPAIFGSGQFGVIHQDLPRGRSALGFVTDWVDPIHSGVLSTLEYASKSATLTARFGVASGYSEEVFDEAQNALAEAIATKSETPVIRRFDPRAYPRL